MRWDYVIILIILGLLVPWHSRARLRALLDSQVPPASQRLGLYLSTIAFQLAIVAVIGWRFHVHNGNWRALGFALPYVVRAIIAAISLSALLVLNQILGVKRLAQLPAGQRGIPGRLASALLPRTRREKWAAFALVLTVAVCEEVIYRGFVEHVFQWELSSVAWGAVISSGFFAVAHLYQGRRGLVATFVVGLLLSLVRIWTAGLLAPIAIHFAADFSAGVASLRLLKPLCDGLAPEVTL